MEDYGKYIQINPSIMLGKPVIKGTRITVESIIDEMAAGYSLSDILRAHPRLTGNDVYASLHYVSSIMKNEKIYTTNS